MRHFRLSAAVLAPKCPTSESMAPAVSGMKAMVGTAGGRRAQIQYAPPPSTARRMAPVAQTRAFFANIVEKALFVTDNNELYPDPAGARIVHLNYAVLVALTHCPYHPRLIRSEER